MATNLSPHISTGLDRLLHRGPLHGLREEVDGVLAKFSRNWDGGWLTTELRPAVDVCETDEAIQVRIDLPGIKPEDVDVVVRKNTLQIRGERKEDCEENGTIWHRTERRTGKFARELTLPCEVQEEKVEAHYVGGVLNITLPKSEEARTRKIAVKANEST